MMASIDLSTREVFESQKLGANLVSQVLEDAFLIANAAKDSGQPWQYLSMLKSFRPDSKDLHEQLSFEASKGDGNMNDDKDQAGSIMATSTPQKDNDESVKPKPESFIGQGDEDFEVTRQEELNKSTSMFISQLFDMSEVERVIICDDEETVQQNITGNDLLSHAMMKIMDSYVNAAFSVAAFEQDTQLPEVEDVGNEDTLMDAARNAEQSCLSFLTEVLGGNLGKEMGFIVDDIDDDNDNPSSSEERVIEVIDEDGPDPPPEIVVQEFIDEQCGVRDVIIIEELVNDFQDANANQITSDENAVPIDEQLDESIVVIEEDETNHLERNDVLQYGEMYSTLNRDCEPLGSEEEEPVLRDPKEMTMQEIELMTAHTSEESLSSQPPVKEEEIKELAATSNVSALSGKSKSSIASRWKSQGARLLSCFRGWWRRKTPGKRKEVVHQAHGSIRNMCPLSPDARRRAASLLDHRDLYSPRGSRSVVWKFNTVNEAVVNSNRYKDYTFDKPDQSGECVRE